jgi:hypothetical protein
MILVGAQAVYLRTGRAAVALAEFTTDADLAIDPRSLQPDPLLEDALIEGGLMRDPGNPNPGAWVSSQGVPVDLMVPDAFAGAGRRSATVPPHDRGSMRRTRGLEAALVDNSFLRVDALGDDDPRSFEIRVAGGAALLVAKLHKIGERRDEPQRLQNKDAHDIYRLLVAMPTEALAGDLRRLLSDEVSNATTTVAVGLLEELFAAGREALGADMAGRAEAGIGDPVQTALAVSFLAADLMDSLRSSP